MFPDPKQHGTGLAYRKIHTLLKESTWLRSRQRENSNGQRSRSPRARELFLRTGTLS